MNVGGVLFDILVVLVAAKLAAEVAERAGIPVVLAEIVAGIIIGPSVLGAVGGDEVLRVLGEIGVILLLLDVGLETDLAELGAVGRASVLVAIVGVVLPFAGGSVAALLLGEQTKTAIFVGAALTATSVGITARVFGDLRALATVEARTVLGAAVADDVLGLIILTVVVRIAGEGSFSISAVLQVVGVALAFLVVTAAVGIRLAPPVFKFVHQRARSAGTLVALVFAFTLGLGELASAAKLAPIVGAFVAGLALSRSDQSERMRRELTPVGHLFIPVFFLQIGIDAQVSVLKNGHVLALAGLLFVVAVVGKIIAAVGAAGSPGDKRLIGLGMIPRGEVGLIFAGLGLREHVLGDDLYAALIVVVLATTLVTPPLLKWRLTQLRARRRSGLSAPTPDGGWLHVADGVVDLAGVAPSHLALPLALDAALAAADARPSSDLLDYFGLLPDEPLRWDGAATDRLFVLLRRGNARSWRLLDTTGVLERALPELAAAVRRRQADPLELDAARALRWSLVERLHELTEGDDADPLAVEEHADLNHPEWLLLAALILDTAGDSDPPVAIARQLVKRLDLGAGAEEEIALLVGESGLLRSAGARADALDESRVIPIADHLRHGERAAALYLLSLALGGLDAVDRARLDELHRRVQVVLGEGGVVPGARPARMSERLAAAERLAVSRAVAERVAATPPTYVPYQPAEAIARQADLLEPLPPRGRARVLVTACAPERWCIDVASRDQPGLLSRVTAVLAGAGLDVLSAAATTWGDGGAIDAFEVRAAGRPDQATLELAINAGLRAPIMSPSVDDAEVTFDDIASPWYTLCAIRATDHPGLLHAFATAISAAGASVHGATIDTDGDMAIDRFELTDTRGRKLDEGTKSAIVRAVAAGVPPIGRSRLRRLGRKSQSRNIHMTAPKPSDPTVGAGL